MNWIFIIDTKQNACSFDMEMASYLVGSNENVSNKFTDLYHEETNEIMFNVQVIEPEKTFYSVWETPNMYDYGECLILSESNNDPVALSLYQTKLLEIISQEKEFIINNDVKENNEKQKIVDEINKTHEKLIEFVNNNINKYKPKNAYCSVALFFNRRPSKKQISFLKERAKKFVDIYKKIYGHEQFYEDITITGFRMFLDNRKDFIPCIIGE